ncbi:MAG: hypothetical protein V1834_00765 [Candidatus Micrarchaeota archaeon]
MLLPASVFFITDTLNDMGFVIRVIVFSYILFWLYITFREAQLLFGLTAIIASYFVLFHSISTTVLIILFFAFVIFGTQLQMVLQFGLLPLLGYHFYGKYQKIEDPHQLQAIQQKAAAGEALSENEMHALQQSQFGSQLGVDVGSRERMLMG